jgi:hypothetical protein
MSSVSIRQQLIAPFVFAAEEKDEGVGFGAGSETPDE